MQEDIILPVPFRNYSSSSGPHHVPREDVIPHARNARRSPPVVLGRYSWGRPPPRRPSPSVARPPRPLRPSAPGVASEEIPLRPLAIAVRGDPSTPSFSSPACPRSSVRGDPSTPSLRPPASGVASEEIPLRPARNDRRSPHVPSSSAPARPRKKSARTLILTPTLQISAAAASKLLLCENQSVHLASSYGDGGPVLSQERQRETQHRGKPSTSAIAGVAGMLCERLWRSADIMDVGVGTSRGNLSIVGIPPVHRRPRTPPRIPPPEPDPFCSPPEPAPRPGVRALGENKSPSTSGTGGQRRARSFSRAESHGPAVIGSGQWASATNPRSWGHAEGLYPITEYVHRHFPSR